MIHRPRTARFPIFGLVSLLGLFGALDAAARSESLRWTHPAPEEVSFFEAFVGPSSGSYEQTISLGMPQPDAEGVFSATVEVPDATDAYIAVRAVGPDAVVSPLSNERFRAAAVDDAPADPDMVPVDSGETMPSTAGAEARFDFEGASTGSPVDGWLDTRENNSLVEDDSLFEVRSLGGNEVLTTMSTRADIHSHVSGNGEAWTAPQLRGRMAIEHPDASIGVTAHSQYPAADVYYRLGRNAGGAFRIEGHPTLSCSNRSTGVVPEAGAWYRFQLEIVEESSQARIRARVWPEDQPEPSGYQAECTDSSSSRPAGGTIGVWSAGFGGKFWDDLEVVQPADAVVDSPLEPPVLIQVIPVSDS